MAEAYILPRDASESTRLNQQHIAWRDIIGHLLHPRIATSLPKQDAEIADVATGTGVWLLDLAAQQPGHRYFGLDLSDAQFPTKHPSSVTFSTLSILETVPSEFQSRFDVVHVRLLVLGLVGEQWHTAARNLLMLLKPGGWLQWEEGDFRAMQSLSATGEPCEALARIHIASIKVAQTTGRMPDEPLRLGEILEAVGFKDVEDRAVASDSVEGKKAAFTATTIQAMWGMLKIGRVEEGERERLMREAERCSGDGAWYRADIRVALGRKGSV